MSDLLGGLIQQIRCGHGDSLRDAAARTGLDKSLINRLEHNRPVRNRHTVLAQFSTAYGVDPETLLEADTPRFCFRAQVGGMTPEMRAEYLWTTFERRVCAALDFATNEEGARLDLDAVAAATGMTRAELLRLRTDCLRGYGDRAKARRIAAALTSLGGVPPVWFTLGLLREDPGIDQCHGVIQWALDLARTAPGRASSGQGLAAVSRIRGLVESL